MLHIVVRCAWVKDPSAPWCLEDRRRKVQCVSINMQACSWNIALHWPADQFLLHCESLSSTDLWRNRFLSSIRAFSQVHRPLICIKKVCELVFAWKNLNLWTCVLFSLLKDNTPQWNLHSIISDVAVFSLWNCKIANTVFLNVWNSPAIFITLPLPSFSL